MDSSRHVLWTAPATCCGQFPPRAVDGSRHVVWTALDTCCGQLSTRAVDSSRHVLWSAHARRPGPCGWTLNAAEWGAEHKQHTPPSTVRMSPHPHTAHRHWVACRARGLDRTSELIRSAAHRVGQTILALRRLQSGLYPAQSKYPTSPITMNIKYPTSRPVTPSARIRTANIPSR